MSAGEVVKWAHGGQTMIQFLEIVRLVAFVAFTVVFGQMVYQMVTDARRSREK